MNLDHNKSKVLVFNKVDEIPTMVWEELNCSQNLYFSSNYLEALEKNNSHLSFFYLVLKNENEKAIAFANAQIINFQLKSLENDTTNFLKKITSIGRRLTILPKKNRSQLLTVETHL